MVTRTPSLRGRWLRVTAVIALLSGGVSACDDLRDARRPAGADGPLALQIGTALPARGVQGVGVPAVVRRILAETPLTTERTGRVVPRLADRWEWLDDGRTLKLTVPPGIRFHDGSMLDARTAAAILRADFASERMPPFKSVSHVETPDKEPGTILIRLWRRDAFLPEALADVFVTRGTIGTGAFMLEGAAKSDKDLEAGATLRAFDAYRQGRPAIARVDVKPYQSLRSAWSAMMRGDINMLYEVSRDAAEFVEQESSIRSYPYIRPYVFNVAFNMRHPVLGRRDVRQALSQAVDRAGIVREGMRGRGEPADGPVWKYHWAYSTAQRTYDYNPEAARLRLDAAGFTPKAAGSGRMSGRLRFTCLMYGDDPRFERIALVLQKQLYDIGVDMQIEALPLRELVSRMQTGRFDAFLFERLAGTSLLWTYVAWRSQPHVGAGDVNNGYTAADAALDHLREVAITEAETRSAVGEVQRVFYEDPPALFLAWPQTSRAVSGDIEVTYQANTDIVGRIWSFKRAAPQAASR